MNESWRTAIIADDLTGACDTGVQFASPGSPSTVLIAGSAIERPGDGIETILGSHGRVIVDTESRHVTATEAYDRVRAVADHLGDSSVDLMYKKIDSTLRGNVLSEIGALQDSFPDRITLIAPTYPAAGRTVVDGRCLVKGTPVDETEFGRDRQSPVTSAKLADYVRAGAGIIETRADTLAGVLRKTRPGEVVIVDACTDDELDAIADLVAADPRRYIPVGSAGLAGAIHRARAAAGSDSSTRPHPSPYASSVARPEAVLGLVGSVSERSRVQAARLLESSDVVSVILDSSRVSSQAEDVATTLSAGHDVLLITPMPPDREPSHGGGSPHAEAHAMAHALGQIARKVVDKVPRIGLFVTGGDTALSVMSALDTRTLVVYRELAAGIPVVAIEYRNGESQIRIPTITKAGGFGADKIMIEAFTCLRGGTCLQ